MTDAPKSFPLGEFMRAAKAVARENVDLLCALAAVEAAEPAYFDDDEAMQALEHVMDDYDTTFRTLADH